MISVLGLGDNVVDIYLNTGTMYPGGNALNFAVFAKFLGYQAGYLGMFGDDEPARHVYDTAAAVGLDLNHCRFFRGENGAAKVQISDGERIFLSGNHGGISKEHRLELTGLDEAYIQKFAVVHTSCYSYCEHLLPQIKGLGVRLTFDFSDRLIPEYLAKVCPYIDCAVMSCGHLSDEQMIGLIKAVHGHGTPMVLATRGTRGALLGVGGQSYEQPPYLVKAKDTMAAGDSFLTAFLCSYYDGLLMEDDSIFPPEQIKMMKKEQYETNLIKVSLHRAAVFSAQNCLRDGSFGFGAAY